MKKASIYREILLYIWSSVGTSLCDVGSLQSACLYLDSLLRMCVCIICMGRQDQSNTSMHDYIFTSHQSMVEQVDCTYPHRSTKNAREHAIPPHGSHQYSCRPALNIVTNARVLQLKKKNSYCHRGGTRLKNQAVEMC